MYNKHNIETPLQHKENIMKSIQTHILFFKKSKKEIEMERKLIEQGKYFCHESTTFIKKTFSDKGFVCSNVSNHLSLNSQANRLLDVSPDFKRDLLMISLREYCRNKILLKDAKNIGFHNEFFGQYSFFKFDYNSVIYSNYHIFSITYDLHGKKIKENNYKSFLNQALDSILKQYPFAKIGCYNVQEQTFTTISGDKEKTKREQNVKKQLPILKQKLGEIVFSNIEVLAKAGTSYKTVKNLFPELKKDDYQLFLDSTKF